MNIKRIGIDLAKQVFQLHAVNDHDKPVMNKRLSRQQMLPFFAKLAPTLIGMEACAGAHYWARRLTSLGHVVKLMPPQFVKPYVKSNKNDANDAEAICEALSRPTMRFVTVKPPEQLALQALHRVRQRVTRARTALINETKGLLAEHGIVISTHGATALCRQLPAIIDEPRNELCPLMRQLLRQLYDELTFMSAQLDALTKQVLACVKNDERIQRLLAIEGIGPINASALVAQVGDAKQFRSGRQFAAYLGLVPTQHSSGGKERLGRISKRGNPLLRTLLIHGARAAVNASRKKHDARSLNIQALEARRDTNVTTVAVANKNARIIWALLSKGQCYRKSN
ncbi:IS110 family transposase [Permianibacter aggregans]|nr:IS110 family transposase [Permianibacter aggregans]QGX38886.1 IS110 family transposase [Permianibacter aggregans]QGX38905.1 IS110 family transposase [Permianibacter aggregans]